MKRQFLLVLLVLCFSLSFGQVPDKYRKLDWRLFHSLNWRGVVDYQSEEWKNMPIESKKSLLQIPPGELQSLSIKALIEASIDCFFARKIGKFSIMDRYYEEVYEGFNGFRELVRRDGVGKELIGYYGDMDVASGASSEAGLSMKRQVQILEYLIVHPKILDNLGPAEMNQLLGCLKDKYAEKILVVGVYSERDRISTIYALARVLDRMDLQISTRLHNIDQIDVFLSSGILLTAKARDEILKICRGM